eukprot:RCo016419
MGDSDKNEKDLTAAADVILHPLVILNVTDHFTRQKVNQTKVQWVLGALLGTQTGRRVEIHTSFELVYTIAAGQIQIDKAFLAKKLKQFGLVFPLYEIMGWYISGSTLGEHVQAPHKTIMEYNESPLLLLVNCEPTALIRDLPAFMFETVFHIVDETPVTSFAKIPYRIESEESERISVDHITHLQPGVTGESSTLVKQLSGMKDAVWMLQQRVKVIRSYLEAVQRGEHPRNLSLLRSIKSLCNKLPAMDSEKFTAAYQTGHQDALLISYLGLLTKGCHAMSEVVDKFSVITEHRKRM